MVNINDEFSSIENARQAIRRHTLDDGESYTIQKSDQKRYIITCKAIGCRFRIRASKTKKGVKIIVKIPYTCKAIIPTILYITYLTL